MEGGRNRRQLIKKYFTTRHRLRGKCMFMKVNKIPEERIFERIYSDKNYRGIRVFFHFRADETPTTSLLGTLLFRIQIVVYLLCLRSYSSKKWVPHAAQLPIIMHSKQTGNCGSTCKNSSFLLWRKG